MGYSFPTDHSVPPNPHPSCPRVGEEVRQERRYHCATPYFAETRPQQPCEPPKATHEPNSHLFATSLTDPSNSRSTWTRRTSLPWVTSWIPSAPSTESLLARRPSSPSTANTDKRCLLVTNKLIKEC